MEILVTNKELQDVKDLIASVVSALNNYNLYPENHPLFQKLISDTYERFKTYFKNFDSLKIDIEKNRLFYKDEIVYQEESKDCNIAFVLFRDGIRWIDFKKSLNRDEIHNFLGILKSFSTLNENAEEDLVTAFWEADYKNIQYKAVDIYWDSEPLTELNKFSVSDPKSKKGDFDESLAEMAPIPDTVTSAENGLFNLKENEILQLREMIIEEDKREVVNDLFSLITFFVKDNKHDFDTEALLFFIKTELNNIIQQGNLKLSFLVLRALHNLNRYSKNVNPSLSSTIEQYIKAMSEPSYLNVLQEGLRYLNASNPKQVDLLKNFIILLSPTAISSIVPMLPNIQYMNIQEQLLDAILILSIKDSKPLEKILKNCDEQTLLKLLYVVDGLPEDKSIKILLETIKNHSGKVRMRSFKYLILKKSVPLKQIFPLIEDSDQTVRELILKYISQNKSENNETLLREYLQKKRLSSRDSEFILDCYKSLGKCGSSRSLPFLRNILFKNRLIPSLRGLIHQKGSVVALSEINNKEAHDILEEASRSFFPVIRFAYKTGLAAFKMLAITI